MSAKISTFEIDGVQYAPRTFTEAVISQETGKTLPTELGEKATKTEVDVLKGRMDNFEALPEGSTTGDAELLDIRVDADGKTYSTAGEAVRGQVSSLNKDITTLKSDNTKNKTDIATLQDDVSQVKTDITTLQNDTSQLKEDSAYQIALAIKCETSESKTLHIEDSADYPLQELHVYGKSTQDGTPTPENPVEIKSVENPTVTINNGDGLSQTQQLTVTLNGIGDVRDEICEYNGQIGVLRRLKTLINAKWSSSITGISSGLYRYQTSVADKSAIKNCSVLCSKFKQMEVDPYWKEATYITTQTADKKLNICSTTISTLAEFDEIAKDMVIIYPLETPTFEPLSEDVQEQYRQLKSYYGTTNISTDQDTTLKAKYVADTKIYIDNQISELSATLVQQA